MMTGSQLLLSLDFLDTLLPLDRSRPRHGISLPKAGRFARDFEQRHRIENLGHVYARSGLLRSLPPFFRENVESLRNVALNLEPLLRNLGEREEVILRDVLSAFARGSITERDIVD